MAICLSKYGQGGAAQSLYGPIDFELAVNVATSQTIRMILQLIACGPAQALGRGRFPRRFVAVRDGLAPLGATL
ncbi:MAG TPA: hypothetical protein VII56_04220 [Rhizomicrobium sp.]